jgi:hypothetical protein
MVAAAVVKRPALACAQRSRVNRMPMHHLGVGWTEYRQCRNREQSWLTHDQLLHTFLKAKTISD